LSRSGGFAAMTRTLPVLLLALAVGVAGGQNPKDPPKKAQTGPAFEETPFGQMPPSADKKTGKKTGGEQITQYTLVNRNGVRFQYTSPGMEEGYPGTLSVTMTYLLNDANELVIEYRATTDKPTLCNLAHHSYFNLAGHNSGDVLGHKVQIFAKNYTPADDTLIPTGKIEPVAGTPFDFTQPKEIGKDLQKTGGKPVGYDLNFVLDKGTTERPELAARV